MQDRVCEPSRLKNEMACVSFPERTIDTRTYRVLTVNVQEGHSILCLVNRLECRFCVFGLHNDPKS